MNTIEKMREVADLLVNQRKYNEAYTIFDEVYRQIWSIFGTVQYGLSGYSNNYLRPRISSDYMLRKQYPELGVNVLCARVYNINLSLMLSEFVRIIQGHLHCINSSSQVRKEISPDVVLNEFAVLYTLALQPVQQRKLIPIFSIATAVVDRNNRVKRIISNYPRILVEKLLLENAQKCKDGKLKSINYLLLDYLINIGDRKSELFRKLSNIVGHYSSRYQYNQNYSGWHDKYEPYGRHRQHSFSSSNKFYSATATDEEKNAYYGQLIGLMGKVTKEQIRSKYIGLISLYHPDRVQHLGPEFKKLAEMKSKEINAAYDWLKSKYHI
ncbi:MAG: J domain-containing protein [Bacteroidota bacterium]